MSTRFALDISKFVNKAKNNIDQVVRKVVIDLGSRVVQKSPVGDASYWISPPPPGYVGGRFRGNWQFGLDQIPQGDLPDIDASGRASIGRVTTGMLSAPIGHVYYLMNNLPYSERIENGWSHRQAPQGVVHLTVMEFKSIVDGAASQVNK